MGASSVIDMIEQVETSVALAWHLSSNMYPPIHHSFIPVAEEAIAHANYGDLDHTILLPNGIELSVETIVEELHLEFFVTFDDGE